MATTVRTGNAGRDQKTGTSPSSSSPFGKKSARPSLSSSSSSSTTRKNSPTMDRKQPPSYLRPTKSSKSLDPSPVPKRSNTDSSAQKTTTTRRRSFDRPPPASQVQKAIQGSPGAREAKTLRSSSFSIKSTSSSPLSARAGLERQSSLGKVPVRDRKVEPQLSKSRNLNRGAMASKTVPKGSSKLALNKKGPKSVTSESSNECDNHSVEHLVSDDEIGYVHDKNQSLPEISEMPDSNEELKDPTNVQLEANHVEEEKHVEEEEDQKDEGGEEDQKDEGGEEVQKHAEEEEDQKDDHEEEPIAAEEVTEEPAPQEIETPEKEEEHPAVENQPEVHHESVDENPTAEHQAQVQSEEESVQSVEPSNQTGEAAGNHDETNEEPPKVEPTDTSSKEKEEEKEKEKEKEQEKKEELPAKEAEKSEEKTEVKDQKQSVRNSSPLAKSQSAGKKGNQAYNDVIEQTASKLMGKKNKVLALAGAFETVISLQDRKN